MLWVDRSMEPDDAVDDREIREGGNYLGAAIASVVRACVDSKTKRQGGATIF